VPSHQRTLFKSMYALAALGATKHVSVLEQGLFDVESSVRIAAAGALAKVNGANSPARIMSALEQMRAQSQDKWLAWLAYEVVHLPYRALQMSRCEA